MKVLALILLFFSASISAQNLHTNAPDLVYPILEEFIAENHLRGEPSFDRINQIDSIIVKSIPLIVMEDRIIKVYGKWHREGRRHWIEVDSSLLHNPQKFTKTLTHELGHVFGLGHIEAPPGTPYNDVIYDQIMCKPSLPYFIPPERFKLAKEKFYDSLKSLDNEKPYTRRTGKEPSGQRESHVESPQEKPKNPKT